MNEQLTEKLLEYLNNGEAFFKEQAPDFVREAMNYWTWDTKFALFFWIAGFIFLGLLLLWCAAHVVLESSEGAAIVFTILLVPFVSSAICATGSYSDLKKIEMAPKLYMLEKLTHHGCSK